MAWIYQGEAMPAAAALAGDEIPPLEVAQALVDMVPGLREDLARTDAQLRQILETARAATDADPG
jgi:hypothetical protein